MLFLVVFTNGSFFWIEDVGKEEKGAGFEGLEIRKREMIKMMMMKKGKREG